MNRLEQIKKPVESELHEFDTFFNTYIKSHASLLNIIASYVIKNKGKQMRPLLVLLSAQLFAPVERNVFHAAALIELMHTATLIHDDVVDESYERRGMFSVNALWRNKIAVLMGDYLLAKGLLLAVEQSEFETLRTVSDAVREMSEGELLQIEKARKLDIREDLYFEIITKKTAVLLAACSKSGAQAAGATPENVEKMRTFGLALGIAFQIKDDLFDYNPGNKTGKPAGNDIREKKITLPLLFALNHVNSSEKKKILRIVGRKNPDERDLSVVFDFVRKNGGFEYAIQQMEEYKQKALLMLSDFEPNEARESLIQFVHYVTDRDK